MKVVSRCAGLSERLCGCRCCCLRVAAAGSLVVAGSSYPTGKAKFMWTKSKFGATAVAVEVVCWACVAGGAPCIVQCPIFGGGEQFPLAVRCVLPGLRVILSFWGRVYGSSSALPTNRLARRLRSCIVLFTMFHRRLSTNVPQELQEERRVIRAEIAADHAETEQSRLQV